jgi:mRNA-degrading endonuclease RelE of RelBE toxin-antitoxin system
MKPLFAVATAPHFERLARGLRRRHADFDQHLAAALEVLRLDPYNRSRTYPIKKLKGVLVGEGQYRIRLGRWRIRYDIYDQTVLLTQCGLRREDTYR